MSEESSEMKPETAPVVEQPVSILDIEAGEKREAKASDAATAPEPIRAEKPEPEQQAARPSRTPSPDEAIDGETVARPKAAGQANFAGVKEPAEEPAKTAGASTDQDAGRKADGPGAEKTANEAGAGAAPAGDKGADKSADKSADKGTDKTDKSAAKEGSDSFDVLDKALKDVKFGYKQMPDGPERERNHKLMTLAEQAFIVSGIDDQKRAEDIWQKHTNKPPSSDLSKRLQEAKENGLGGLPNLSGNLAVIENQSLLAAKHTRMEVMRSQLGEWESAAGDARKRSLDAGRSAQDQLTKPEQADDAGMFLFKSLTMGLRASGEIKQFMIERKRAIEHGKDIDTTKREIGMLAVETKKFEISLGKIDGADRGNTTGLAGQAVKAAMGRGMPGVMRTTGAKVTGAIGDQIKKAAISASMTIDDVTGPRKPSPQATYAAFQQSQMGGMGR